MSENQPTPLFKEDKHLPIFLAANPDMDIVDIRHLRERIKSYQSNPFFKEIIEEV